MARKIKKYNPGFLTDQELVDCFCVRTGEFALLVEALRESTGNSNPHAIVIGPRGSGKTTLLLRVAAEARRDPALQAAWFPVIFPEESYGISSCGEFWLQCLFNLAQQAPRREDAPDLHRTYGELLAVQDDRILADMALAAILDFAATQGKRLLLLVENLNSLFNEIGDPGVGWELRKTLQCEPRIFLLGSATSRFAEIDNAKRALYDLFQVHTLKRLDTEACATLWRSVSERDIDPRAIRSLEILTGGNPRLLSIVAEFGSRLSFRELMDDLLDLVDDHTEYFRSHLEALGAQERRVYLALATLWKPSTASQVSAITRLSASHCSALLKRLVDRGEVIRSGGIPRRREYYLAQRMYNIYYLLRRGRGTNQVVEALVRFMTAFYSEPELVNIFQQITAEASSIEGAMREMLEKALKRALELLPTATSPAGKAEGLQVPFGAQAATSRAGVKKRPGRGPDSRESRASGLAAKVRDLLGKQEYEQVIAACNEIGALLRGVGTTGGARQAADALSVKSVALAHMGRTDEAVVDCNEILNRYGGDDAAHLAKTISTALANKVTLLGRLKRPQEVLAASEAFTERYDHADSPATEKQRSQVLFNRGVALVEVGQPRRARAVFDEVIQRFESGNSVDVDEPVARAMVGKSGLLEWQGLAAAACDGYDEVIKRFGDSRLPQVADAVATAMLRKGGALAERGEFGDALDCFEAVTERFGQHSSPEMRSHLATAQSNRAAMLDLLDKPREAQEAYDTLIGGLTSDDLPDMAENLAIAFANRSTSLMRVGRLKDAFASVDEFLNHFRGTKSPSILQRIGSTLLERAKAEFQTGRPEAAMDTAARVLKEFASNSPENLVLAHLLRAEGYFRRGNQFGCKSELAALLEILPRFEVLPEMSIESLMAYTIRFGPGPVLALIEASPSVNRLYPLVTALRLELGIETKVAKEVEDVASDIRQDLARRRQQGPP